MYKSSHLPRQACLDFVWQWLLNSLWTFKFDTLTTSCNVTHDKNAVGLVET